ncbi:uncharacterized protein LOC122186088 isoform X3 [Lagopus leucura]|uniref:uncharacterized protein LOC122186088 isoform X3 n=1 Tax=Lagopus leucura TaxID=30410 RepID=UPI001C674CF2|nr:uncharacterized protein LOC122186088 isoform X3 [Lagopus leucura]
MGTGRLRSASLILLSLCLAGRSSSLTGWVFTEPWLHASAGDSVLLRCLFQDPEATGWTVTKVDWLRVPVAGKQKHGSIFKNHTMLRVSPATQRDRGAESAQVQGRTGVWAVTVCCSAVAVVLAFLAGLNLRKRSAATTALERARNDGSKDKAKEGLYSSIPEAEVPKADQDAGKKRRAEETYITMHPSILHENGIYVELARGVIPAEWMAEGRRDGGHSEQPYSQPQQELPHVPERGK